MSKSQRDNPFEYSEVEEPEARRQPLSREPAGLQNIYVALFMFAAGLCCLSAITAITDSRLDDTVILACAAVGSVLIAAGLNKDRRWAIWLALMSCSALIPCAYSLLNLPWLSGIAVLLTVGLVDLVRDHAKRRRKFPDLR